MLVTDQLSVLDEPVAITAHLSMLLKETKSPCMILCTIAFRQITQEQIRSISYINREDSQIRKSVREFAPSALGELNVGILGGDLLREGLSLGCVEQDAALAKMRRQSGWIDVADDPVVV